VAAPFVEAVLVVVTLASFVSSFLTTGGGAAARCLP